MIQITDPGKQSQGSFALFALGFRPFFLLASMSAVVLIACWILAFSNGFRVHPGLSTIQWHSHEMVFGYSAAVIAGFLLTAVRNWTGVQTLSGIPLLSLTLLWVVARLLPFTALPLSWFALVDLLFLPAVAIAIAHPIIKVKQWKNAFFILLILLFAVANLFFYAELLRDVSGAASYSINAGLGIVVLIITVMAGRVVGFFIERGLSQSVSTENVRTFQWAEYVSLWMTALYVFSNEVLPDNLRAVVALLAAAGHTARLVGWHHARLWHVPLLWVLYLGYCWLAAAFVLASLSLLNPNWVMPGLATHAFTVGAIGVMTMGMMARVSLGHTGRLMQSHWLVNGAFVLVILAASIRVIFPLFDIEHYTLWIQMSGALWVVAFLCFVIIYLPILVNPRVDGAPG